MSAIAGKVAAETVKTAAGGSINAGIWTLVAVVISGLLAALGIWIKWGPTWKKIEQDGEALLRAEMTKMRDELWKDIGALKLSKEDQSRRLTLAEAQIAGQTVRLGQQAFIIDMLLDEIERLAPGNTIARSAKALLKLQADVMPQAEEIAPMAEVMSKLCVTDETEGQEQ